MPRRLNKNNSRKPVYFNSPTFGLCSAEFESDDDNTITKSALVMVEGEHVDSAKRRHVFGADRIQKIVDNTNNWLAKGGRVPWQRDHKKTQDANIGDLEGNLEARVITEDDLPDPRLLHLVGKVGAFAENLVGKGRDVVEQIRAGRIKTLSPGIDIVKNIMMEVSATPKPAITGLSTFALTMDEAEMEGQQSDQLKEQFEEIGERFLDVVNSIYSATEDELQGQDPQQLLMQAVQDYGARIVSLLGLDQMGQDPSQQQPQQAQQPYTQGAPIPGYLQRQQGFGQQAGFTMADTYALNRAEFFTMPGLPSFGQQPRQQKKQGGSLLGNVVKGAAAIGAGAAAIRYGGAGLKLGSRLARKVPGQMMAAGVTKGFNRNIAYAGAKGIYQGATKQIGRDIRSVGNAAGGVRNAVGSGLGRVGAGIKGFGNAFKGAGGA